MVAASQKVSPQNYSRGGEAHDLTVRATIIGISVGQNKHVPITFDSNNDSARARRRSFFVELTGQMTYISNSEPFINVSSIEGSRLPRRMDLHSELRRRKIDPLAPKSTRRSEEHTSELQ